MSDLRRLAEAATPGPWEHKQYDFGRGLGDVRERTDTFRATEVQEKPYEVPDGRIVLRHVQAYREGDGSGLLRDADAAYIAAAAPDVILALLDRAEQAESAVERLRTRVRDFAATWHTSLGHDGHLDRCTWSTCRGLLTGSIDSGTELRAALTDIGETP